MNDTSLECMTLLKMWTEWNCSLHNCMHSELKNIAPWHTKHLVQLCCLLFLIISKLFLSLSNISNITSICCVYNEINMFKKLLENLVKKAIKNLKGKTRNVTLYVTNNPCEHNMQRQLSLLNLQPRSSIFGKF